MNVKSEIRQKLWESLDMHCLRWELTFSVVVVAIALAIPGVMGGFRDPSYWLMVAVVAGLTLLPLFGYALWLYCRIFREAESYRFYSAKLTMPHGSKFVRGGLYFTVVLEDSDGGKYVVNTRSIFAPNGLAPLHLEDYLNKTVTIAYNEETEMVLVLE